MQSTTCKENTAMMVSKWSVANVIIILLVWNQNMHVYIFTSPNVDHLRWHVCTNIDSEYERVEGLVDVRWTPKIEIHPLKSKP